MELKPRFQEKSPDDLSKILTRRYGRRWNGARVVSTRSASPDWTRWDNFKPAGLVTRRRPNLGLYDRMFSAPKGAKEPFAR